MRTQRFCVPLHGNHARGNGDHVMTTRFHFSSGLMMSFVFVSKVRKEIQSSTGLGHGIFHQHGFSDAALNLLGYAPSSQRAQVTTTIGVASCAVASGESSANARAGPLQFPGPRPHAPDSRRGSRRSRIGFPAWSDPNDRLSPGSDHAGLTIVFRLISRPSASCRRSRSTVPVKPFRHAGPARALPDV